MRVTVALLGWTFDVSLSPDAAEEATDEGSALNGGTLAAYPMGFTACHDTPTWLAYRQTAATAGPMRTVGGSHDHHCRTRRTRRDHRRTRQPLPRRTPRVPQGRHTTSPTPWDRRHQSINELLTNLELLDVQATASDC
jgi:hypothetical protein